MRKISRGYYIAAAVLLVLSAVNFYHYAAIGRELVSYYEGAGIIRGLIQNSLFWGIICVVLCGAVILTGWLRRDREKKAVKSMKAIALRFTAGTVGLWLVCMAAMTYGTAQYIFRELVDGGYELPEYAGRAGMLEYMYYYDDTSESKSVPGLMDYRMLEAVSFAGLGVSSPSFVGYPGLEGHLSIFRSVNTSCDTAAIFLGPEGNILHKSGDFIYFPYVTEESWETMGQNAPNEGYGWLDLSDESDGRYERFREVYDETKSLSPLETLRLTGYFDGARFEPYAIAVADTTAYDQAVDALIPWEELESGAEIKVEVSEDGKSATVSVSGGDGISEEILGKVDRESLLTWDVWFDNTEKAEPGQELVTIYAVYADMYLYDSGDVVRYRDETHETLLDLLLSMDYYRDQGAAVFYNGASQFSLWNLIVFSERSYTDETGWNNDEPYPEPDFTIMTAMRASPMLIAMSFLRTVYIVTGIMAAVCLLFLLRSIKRNFIIPLREINEGMAGGFATVSELREEPPRWAETSELYQRYLDTTDTLRLNKNEITRLDRALDYAKKAEENRRQMVSNIAHELKTPLAVIHSYAEGLKEHIAEDKRDRYLDVILSETERTDALVLEMLDLSRLEAGRVKLARDEFSLISLTEAVFEKLKVMAEAKKLEISFEFPEDFTVTADEGRIGQVIENFATNAIKYTPAGGHITVKIEKKREGAVFSIENESRPLPAKTLEKVWDTFYRADDARSGGGTGLGLAIAKSIVELHGGTCFVRNTKMGVEFSFTI